MKIIIVVATFKGTIEKVIACKDKETSKNFALDLIAKDMEVATFESELWNMEKYQGFLEGDGFVSPISEAEKKGD